PAICTSGAAPALAPPGRELTAPRRSSGAWITAPRAGPAGIQADEGQSSDRKIRLPGIRIRDRSLPVTDPESMSTYSPGAVAAAACGPARMWWSGPAARIAITQRSSLGCRTPPCGDLQTQEKRRRPVAGASDPSRAGGSAPPAGPDLWVHRGHADPGRAARRNAGA